MCVLCVRVSILLSSSCLHALFDHVVMLLAIISFSAHMDWPCILVFSSWSKLQKWCQFNNSSCYLRYFKVYLICIYDSTILCLYVQGNLVAMLLGVNQFTNLLRGLAPFSFCHAIWDTFYYMTWFFYDIIQ